MILLFFIVIYFDVIKIVNNLIKIMKIKRKLKLIRTSDGSDSICDTEKDEIYHSKYGAIQESLHIFINNGLKICPKKNIKILEVGLGTGLNLLLTYLNSEDKKVAYYSLEPFLIPFEIVRKMNYEKLLSINILNYIHTCPSEKKNVLRENFSFFRYESKFLSFNSFQKFDIIYYDAFSPRVQPEMWDSINFKKAYKLLNKKGFLITFCAKGEVKRNLKKQGFKLVHPKGPFGKREITLAIKI